MTDTNRARSRAIRARMATTGEPYSLAARRHDAEHNATAPITPAVDPALLAPYPDELGPAPVLVDELGWRVLPADATPADRARAEASWRPVRADRPCRCSGPCHHGQPCQQDCAGRLLHTDRYPGSVLDVSVWSDDYECDTCDATLTAGTVQRPDLPWGTRDDHSIRPFRGVRHPNFHEIDPDAPELPAGDGHCRVCGDYALSGLVCELCRRQGWTDAYGQLAAPDPDDVDPDDPDELDELDERQA